MGDNDTPGTGRQRLWFSLDRSRRFLVPEQETLAEGGYPIRDLAGQQRAVDPVQLGAFEVSVAAADAWAKAELGRVLRALGGNLRRSFASVPPPANGPPDAPVTPGLDLLAAITDTPRERLDTGGLGEALRGYLGDLGQTIDDAASGDGERIARARARMKEWAATLRAHGTEVPMADATGPVPSRSEPEPAADTGEGQGAGLAARLHGLAAEMRRRADGLAAARAGVSGSAPRPSPSDPARDAQAAAALEALAEGLQGAAGDAAAQLRATALRLRGGRPEPEHPPD